MPTMYKNELFILMYCGPMIPTGRSFHKFLFSMINDEPPIFWAEKLIFHDELERYF